MACAATCLLKRNYGGVIIAVALTTNKKQRRKSDLPFAFGIPAAFFCSARRAWCRKKASYDTFLISRGSMDSVVVRAWEYPEILAMARK